MPARVDDLPQRRSPERIGRYQVLDRIGRGAMGVVYRAHDDAMRRDVALKVLTTDLEDDPDIRVRFHREAEAAAHLSHPNIITIFDVGEDGGRFYIVMELLHGATLKEFLKQSNPPLDTKLDLMLQACAGMRAAHKASIYHRDIKPGNLFVRADGLLKILDFGVARLASSSMTVTGFVVGTPDYMSPEQARGDEIDGRSDVFSLGGVFYFMLTGRKPFAATHLPALFRQIQSEDSTPIAASEAPPELTAIVVKALAKNPDARYQSCEELTADLEKFRVAYRRGVESSPVAEQRNVVAARVAESDPAASASARLMPEADSPGSSSTEDTVDSLPVSMFNPDDTVAMRAPDWAARIRMRVRSIVSSKRSGGRSRTRPAAAPQPAVRKR
jgi:serine/threonine protein kinase